MATPTSSVPSIVTSIIPTKIYIDEVPEYSLLASCAEKKVSSIVRLMTSGCGDGSRATSYACFCYSSSTFYDNLIGHEIQTTCSDLAQVSSAHAVFQKYCAIGQTRGILPSSELQLSALCHQFVEFATNFMFPDVTASTTALSISSSTTSNIATSIPPSSVMPLSSATAPPPAASTTNTSQRTTKIAAGVVVPLVVLAAVLCNCGSSVN